MIRSRRVRSRREEVRREGFVYGLYKENLRNLWILAGILLLVFVSMVYKSRVYLMNYLFFRAEPDPAALQAFVEKDVLDIDAVCLDIEDHGGEMALNRTRTAMFFKDNLYSEGIRYRFRIPIVPEKLEDTGLWYDDTYHPLLGMKSREEARSAVPREGFLTEHLYFYEYAGVRFLLVMGADQEFELQDRERVVFAPLGVYSVYMVKDLKAAGYDGEMYNFFIDLRDTPVDFEDDDFKDLVLLFPFVLLALIPAILFTIFPILHPTYRQLDKFARTIPKAAAEVDANYKEFGILSQDRKEWYLEDWIIKRSPFKHGIQKDYRKQKY